MQRNVIPETRLNVLKLFHTTSRHLHFHCPFIRSFLPLSLGSREHGPFIESFSCPSSPSLVPWYPRAQSIHRVLLLSIESFSCLLVPSLVHRVLLLSFSCPLVPEITVHSSTSSLVSWFPSKQFIHRVPLLSIESFSCLLVPCPVHRVLLLSLGSRVHSSFIESLSCPSSPSLVSWFPVLSIESFSCPPLVLWFPNSRSLHRLLLCLLVSELTIHLSCPLVPWFPVSLSCSPLVFLVPEFTVHSPSPSLVL